MASLGYNAPNIFTTLFRCTIVIQTFLGTFKLNTSPYSIGLIDIRGTRLPQNHWSNLSIWWRHGWKRFPHHWPFMGESTHGFPSQRGSDLCGVFFVVIPGVYIIYHSIQPAVEQRVQLPVIWDVLTLTSHHCTGIIYNWCQITVKHNEIPTLNVSFLGWTYIMITNKMYQDVACGLNIEKKHRTKWFIFYIFVAGKFMSLIKVSPANILLNRVIVWTCAQKREITSVWSPNFPCSDEKMDRFNIKTAFSDIGIVVFSKQKFLRFWAIPIYLRNNKVCLIGDR